MGDPNASRRGHVGVLLADSNHIQCELLSTALRRQHAFRVLSCSAELSSCLAQLQASNIDVILLGGTSPTDDAPQYELIRSLHSRYPNVAIVLLVYDYDRELVIEALRAGARGLFCLASCFKALCRCIHAVHAGQFWVNTEQFSYIVERLGQWPALNTTAVNGQRLLTQREEQIVTLVAEGMGNRQVAAELEITENTVKKALLRIFDKLGISNRVELVLYVLTQRYPEPAPAPVATRPELVKPPQPVQRYDIQSQKAAAPLVLPYQAGDRVGSSGVTKGLKL